MRKLGIDPRVTGAWGCVVATFDVGDRRQCECERIPRIHYEQPLASRVAPSISPRIIFT